MADIFDRLRCRMHEFEEAAREMIQGSPAREFARGRASGVQAAINMICIDEVYQDSMALLDDLLMTKTAALGNFRDRAAKIIAVRDAPLKEP